MPGRITGDTASVLPTVALGAGWATGATAVMTAGSTDNRGQVVITAATTTPAQATSTVTITFAQAFETAPFAIVVEAANTQAVPAEPPTDIVTTTTTLVFKAGVVPVDTKVYTYNYICF